MSPTEPEPIYYYADDGTRLAYYEMGEGPAIVLIHGLFSNAWTNWIRYGHAAKVVAAGFRLIMPDLRAHGKSEAPRDPAKWYPDVLAEDGEALLRHLGLERPVLGGYSLGGRTTVRMLVRGADVRATILGGMGLDGIVHTAGRGGFFRTVLEGVGTHQRGSPEWMAEAFLKTTGGDPVALLPLLDTFVDTTQAELEAIDVPALVISGADDHDNGSSEDLAAVLPQGRYAEIPGNHMSAVLKRELGDEIAGFLASL